MPADNSAIGIISPIYTKMRRRNSTNRAPVELNFTKNDYKSTSPVEDKRLNLFDLRPDTIE